MKGKIGVFVYGALMDELQTIDTSDLDVDIVYYEKLLSPEDVIPSDILNADVFLSAGYNAEILRSLTDKPIISMEASVYDLLLAINQARLYDETPLVIPFGKEYEKLTEISDLFEFNVNQRAYHTQEDLRKILNWKKESGGKCVIATALGCRFAEEIGLKSIYLYPKESVMKYLQIAAESANTLRTEAQNINQITTVVENTGKGLILLDENSKIKFMNKQSKSILHIYIEDESLLGAHVSRLFKNEELKSLLFTNTTISNYLLKMDNIEYALNLIPITLKTTITGYILSIEGVEELQNAEYSIRRKLNDKGFVARRHFSLYQTKNFHFQKIIDNAKKYAASDENIIIIGETGTGKDLMAQSIHNYSDRASKPFVAVNCSAISQTLLESELFGYEEGAFTGAKRGGKAGLFEMAHRGTIFLDEIGDMDMRMQTEILRVLENREVIRIGGQKVIPLDIRVLAATNKPLWNLVEKKEFREDLYYRINVLEIVIPPLRERTEDIFDLFSNFILRQKPELLNLMSRNSEYINELLLSYSWPGNIRELENFAKNISTIIDNNATINDIEQIMTEVLKTRKSRNNPTVILSSTSYQDDLFRNGPNNSLNEIMDALKKCEGNQSLAAKELGISRTTLWRKLKEAKMLNYQKYI